MAGGVATARGALASVIAMAQRRPEVAQDPWEALTTYRMWLFGERGAGEDGSGWRIDPEECY